MLPLRPLSDAQAAAPAHCGECRWNGRAGLQRRRGKREEVGAELKRKSFVSKKISAPLKKCGWVTIRWCIGREIPPSCGGCSLGRASLLWPVLARRKREGWLRDCSTGPGAWPTHCLSSCSLLPLLTTFFRLSEVAPPHSPHNGLLLGWPGSVPWKVTPVCRDQHQPPLHCVYPSHPGEAHHKPPLQVLDPPMVRQPLTQGEKAKLALMGQVFLEGFGFVNCLCRITQKLIQIPASLCRLSNGYFILHVGKKLSGKKRQL